MTRMEGHAGADLVLATVKKTDHLKDRARKHMKGRELKVPFSVGIELLYLAQRYGMSRRALMAATQARFHVERLSVLLIAAQSLDEQQISTVMDAVHAAQAHVDRSPLHTTDHVLQESDFPTVAW